MPPCLFLPQVSREFTHTDIQELGADRSENFYDVALSYAQSLWLEGFPAKSLLLVNRAFSCRLPRVSLNAKHAKPYHAIAWIFVNRPAGRFLGNPRRHYQHLATRMVEPHKNLRVWRAWACWYLARAVLPEDEFPHDADQVRVEGLVKPRRFEIADNLRALSPSDDLEAWESALEWAKPWRTKTPVPQHAPVADIRFIRADEAATVQKLAHEIWPQVYPGIITMAQIDYMLADRYNIGTIEHEIRNRGALYALIETCGEAVGYVSFEEVREDSSIFLNKLYLKPEHHGRGIGALTLRWLEKEALTRNTSAIRLRVNRHNHPAIRAYMRAGFVIERDIITHIGGGFVMDDHVMVKHLTAS